MQEQSHNNDYINVISKSIADIVLRESLHVLFLNRARDQSISTSTFAVFKVPCSPFVFHLLFSVR